MDIIIETLIVRLKRIYIPDIKRSLDYRHRIVRSIAIMQKNKHKDVANNEHVEIYLYGMLQGLHKTKAIKYKNYYIVKIYNYHVINRMTLKSMHKEETLEECKEYIDKLKR